MPDQARSQEFVKGGAVETEFWKKVVPGKISPGKYLDWGHRTPLPL